MYRRHLAVFLCLLPLTGIASSTVYERQLDNGLRILVKPDHRAPILTSQIWYRIGSSYEHNGITGISHLLEHMMFQGTETHPPGDYSRIVAENGGEENAFTGRDYTAYYQNLASDRLEISFALEADRMRNLTLGQDEFAKELAVVKEERRMRTEDDPQSLTEERFMAAAFDVSTYHNPVIGWPGDLEQMRVEDLRDWYRLWYAPNNATLVVAGDVEPEQVFALAEKYFGSLRAEAIPAPKIPSEPPQLGEKRLRVAAPAKEPYLLMGYKTPVIAGADAPWEPYALEILASVLDGGDSARFATDLVRGRQIAASAGASYSAFQRLPGLFLFDGVPTKGHEIGELEQAIREQIRRVQDTPVRDDELARVRTQVIADKVYDKDSLFNQAMQLGLLASLGLDWRLADTYVDALAAVTPAQVQAVARKYLNPDRLTVTILDPRPIADDRPAAATMSKGGHSDVR